MVVPPIDRGAGLVFVVCSVGADINVDACGWTEAEQMSLLSIYGAKKQKTLILALCITPLFVAGTAA
jgi:hypothetical protein